MGGSETGAARLSAATAAHYWAGVAEGDAAFLRFCHLGDDDNEPEPGVSLALEDGRGLPTLHRLAALGHVPALRVLLADVRADPNQRERAAGQTPLHLAAAKGQLEAAQLLLESGADAAARDAAGGWSALHAAARAGQDELIDCLLRGAPPGAVDARADGGDTPLMRAAFWGRASAVERLLAHGADRRLANGAGADALALACAGPYAEQAALPGIRALLLRPDRRGKAGAGARAGEGGAGGSADAVAAAPS